MIDLRLGDCLQVLREIEDCSVDAVVTDPPYGINFMGKAWDGKAIEQAASQPRDLSGIVRLTGGADSPTRKLTARTGSAFANRAGEAGAYDFSPKGNRAFQAWCEQWGAECLRVLKPGGHAVVFSGTRTYHRLAAGLEDAGFEIRDTLCWLFGQGFPKSMDVAKAIDAKMSAVRERQAPQRRATESPSLHASGFGKDGWAPTVNESVTAAAAAWEGWGTALKPGYEPIVLARKPLDGTVATNVLAHGTGALNIDGCRIGTEGGTTASGQPGKRSTAYSKVPWKKAEGESWRAEIRPIDGGRWPANVLLDELAAELLDQSTGELQSGAGPLNRHADKFRTIYGSFAGEDEPADSLYGDRGGASRFFYCAKTSRGERNAGLEPSLFSPGVDEQEYEHSGPRGHTANGDGTPRPRPRPRGNIHPTVKPLAVMRWLIRLVSADGAVILDPFLGSGTTGCAAELEGRDFIGIEREDEYMGIAQARISYWATRPIEATA